MEMLHDLDVNWNAIAVIVGTTVAMGILFWKPVQDYLRGLKMKQQRRDNLHQYYLGKLVSLVEDDVKEGHLTRDEATKEIYEPFKRVFHRHKDLYPSEPWLKKGIKRRMENGTHDPAPLPETAVKKKRLFDKA